VTDFEFAFQTATYASALWMRLHIPALKKLTLDFASDDETDEPVEEWDNFVRLLCTPGVAEAHIRFEERRQDFDYSTLSPIPPSRLSQVEDFRIGGLQCSPPLYATLFSCLTNVKKLRVDFNFIDYEEVLSLLQGTYSDTGTTTSAHDGPGLLDGIPPRTFKHPYRREQRPKQIFLPLLEEFRVSGVLSQDLRAIIDARKKEGHPVKHLSVDSGDDMSPMDELWLRDNVETMDTFEPSDVETVEDDISDWEDDDDDDDDYQGGLYDVDADIFGNGSDAEDYIDEDDDDDDLPDLIPF